jgi:hypothetical protein
VTGGAFSPTTPQAAVAGPLASTSSTLLKHGNPCNMPSILSFPLSPPIQAPSRSFNSSACEMQATEADLCNELCAIVVIFCLNLDFFLQLAMQSELAAEELTTARACTRCHDPHRPLLAVAVCLASPPAQSAATAGPTVIRSSALLRAGVAVPARRHSLERAREKEEKGIARIDYGPI